MSSRTLALFPGGLGDLLCCWPALRALSSPNGAALTLGAREPWFAALPAGAVTPLSIDRREIADLFGSGALADTTRSLLGGFARVESWTGAGDENFSLRLASASGGPVRVHPFRDFVPGEHAMDYYARCLGVVPAGERLGVRDQAAEWAAQWWRDRQLASRAIAVHAGSGSARKSWQGMAAVAAAWRAAGGHVISIAGPAEVERGAAIPHDALLAYEPLDRVAAVLAHAAGYLGNDSGISHLAGMVGARTVALFGSSDPLHWQPRGGAVHVLHAPQPCRRCGPERFCTHRLSVDEVLQTLRRTALS
jgi:ADP-heptose:LPS heptosyltransferase